MQLELEIEKVAHGGVFIARPEGKVVLVHGALPGERVLAEVTEEAKSFRRADVVEVITPSAHRVPHFWPAATRGVGGAEFGHIELGYQRVLKGQVLTEAMNRMAGIAGDFEVAAVDETELHYRTRIQLHADKHGRLGVKKRRSDEVVQISSHPLAVSEINQSGIFTERYSQGNRVEISVDNLGLVAKTVNGKGPDVTLQYTAGDRSFKLSPGTFWQAHRAAPEVLVQAVSEQLLKFDGVDKVLDLYSGAGLFAANIAAKFGASVTAVESSPGAVSDGKKSSADLTNLKFQKADVLSYLRSQTDIPSTLVLDPPRSGAATKVVSEIIRLRPAQIVYVACDPVALARDIKLLSAAGYELTKTEAFDIFPQTHHFETVVSLRLGNL